MIAATLTRLAISANNWQIDVSIDVIGK